MAGPPSPAEFALQKQQFLYAQKKAFQKAHGSVKPGVTKGGPGGPGGPTMTSVQKQLLKQRTPHPGDVGARVSVVGYNCFGTLRYYGPTPGASCVCGAAWDSLCVTAWNSPGRFLGFSLIFCLEFFIYRWLDFAK